MLIIYSIQKNISCVSSAIYCGMQTAHLYIHQNTTISSFITYNSYKMLEKASNHSQIINC